MNTNEKLLADCVPSFISVLWLWICQSYIFPHLFHFPSFFSPSNSLPYFILLILHATYCTSLRLLQFKISKPFFINRRRPNISFFSMNSNASYYPKFRKSHNIHFHYLNQMWMTLSFSPCVSRNVRHSFVSNPFEITLLIQSIFLATHFNLSHVASAGVVPSALMFFSIFFCHHCQQRSKSIISVSRHRCCRFFLSEGWINVWLRRQKAR